jgi:predicted ATPase
VTDEPEDSALPESSHDALIRAVARSPARSPVDAKRSLGPHELSSSIIGSRLADRFVVERRLGEGGMGIVYEALDEQRQKRVALKTLGRMDATAIYRLKHEFRALADLVHPNLVLLHELFSDDGIWFFTMARVDGVSFLEHVRDETGFVEDKLRSAVTQLAAGVRAIHAAGKLHRDLKPSNVLVGADRHLTILDFGLVSTFGEHTTRSHDGTGAGTPAYMAPEQLTSGGPCPASDWYAIGVMLFQALTGRMPFMGTISEIISAKMSGRAPESVRALSVTAPQDLADLASALLSSRPEARPGAKQIWESLAASPNTTAQAIVGPLSAIPEKGAFIGRERELAALHRAFSRTRAGESCIVRIAGSSGIGKTALVDRFIEDLKGEAPDAVILCGRCHERESVPFKALDSIIDSLTRHLARLPPVAAALLTPRDVPELCRIFPVLARVEPFAGALAGRAVSPDPREVRRRAFQGLRELFMRITDTRALVVVIDDLQWGDLDSGQLISHLVAQPDPPKILVVVAHRSNEPEGTALSSLLTELEGGDRQGRMEIIALEPLGDVSAKELASALVCANTGQRDEPLASAIAAEAGGSPFFILELARASGETRASSSSLDSLIRTRIAVLQQDARQLLEVVATGGSPVLRSVALRATRLAPSNESAIAALRAASLLRTTEEWLETYHDRVRETVVAGISTSRRREIHADIAEALGSLPSPPLESLAYHCREAGRSEYAAELLIKSAEAADQVLAFKCAADLYQAALDVGHFDFERSRRLVIARADAAMRHERRATLVGREAEVAHLEDLLPSQEVSKAMTVAIVGDAGIGKTRLSEAIMSAARLRGIRVLSGAAYETDEPLPYSLLSDLLSRWAREDPALVDFARDHPLLRALGRLVPLFGVGAPTPDRLSARDERFRLLEAAAQLFRMAVRDGPLLVVLEDVHWADRDSWSMLRHVARAMRDLPVLFVLTTRPDGSGGEPEGLSDLTREIEVRRIILDALDLDGTVRMLEALAGERLPVGIVQTIQRESGGNPFYLRHIFEHLVEEGKLQRRQGRWSTSAGFDELSIPRGVRSLLSRRIVRLSNGAVGMLRLASVYADRFDLARLLALSDEETHDQMLDYLDEALEVGVIVAGEHGYAFAHALLRRALRDGMNPDRRARLHRRAAEQLAFAGEDAGEIARHYHASRRLPGAEIGIDFALRAAERAAHAYLYEHQALFLRIAVDLQGEQVSAESLRELALAEAAALDSEAAESTAWRLLECVRGGDADPSWMLDFLAMLARRLKDAGAAPSAWLPFVTLGLDACAGRRDLAWARLEIQRPRWQCRWDGLVCVTTQLPSDSVAQDILRRLGEDDDDAETLDPFELRTREETEAVRARAERWRSAAAIIRARDVVARDWMFRHGDIRIAAERLRELARDSERFGSLPGRAEAYTQLVAAEATLGRLEASDEALREARSLTARLGPVHRLHSVLQVAVATVVAYLYRGEWAPLREASERALKAVVGQQAPIGLVLLGQSAMAEAFSPEPGEYEERIEALLCSLERTDLRMYLANAALTLGVIAIFEREDVKRAFRFEKLVREAVAHGVGGGPSGDSHALSLARLAALRKGVAEARALYAEARLSLEEGGLCCQRAMVDLEEARLRDSTGDTESCRALLDEARRRFDALGMRFWSERAARLQGAGSQSLFAFGREHSRRQ